MPFPDGIEGSPSGARVFYTDGSVLRASDPAVATAGWGFTDGKGYGCFGAMPGFNQSINRAELWAVLRCASAQQDSHVICTDSQYVVAGAAVVVRGQSPSTHKDLWAQYRTLPVQPWLLKVAAHLTSAQAALRGQPDVVCDGNASADRFARLGASAPPWFEEPIAARANGLALARRVHEAQWQLLRAILGAEKRPLGARRLRRRFHHWVRRPGRSRPMLSYGAHQVVPSGTGSVCLLCQRTSASIAPRAWRYRPCLPRVRRGPHEAAAHHVLWHNGDKVGCHLCGRTSGIRWKSRLLSAPCDASGPRALPAFDQPLRPLPAVLGLDPVAAFSVPLGTAEHLELLQPSVGLLWPGTPARPRVYQLPAEASASHLLWESFDRVGCNACRRCMRRRDRHRLLHSMCSAHRLAFRGLSAGSSEPVPVVDDDPLVVSAYLRGTPLIGSRGFGLIGPCSPRVPAGGRRAAALRGCNFPPAADASASSLPPDASAPSSSSAGFSVALRGLGSLDPSPLDLLHSSVVQQVHSVECVPLEGTSATLVASGSREPSGSGCVFPLPLLARRRFPREPLGSLDASASRCPSSSE
ncbi:MAG: hypothetical protein GY772_30545 [bacterium]|nr:hypothetical protein [bacterium]